MWINDTYINPKNITTLSYYDNDGEYGISVNGYEIKLGDYSFSSLTRTEVDEINEHLETVLNEIVVGIEGNDD